MARFSSPASSVRRFFFYWTRRETVVFALEMAGWWAPTLTMSLQCDVLLLGKAPTGLFLKLLLTAVILYLVASFSFVCASMDRDRE